MIKLFCVHPLPAAHTKHSGPLKQSIVWHVINTDKQQQSPSLTDFVAACNIYTKASFVLSSLCLHTAVRSQSSASLFVFFPPQQRRRLDTDHADWCCAVIPSPAESVSHARERAFVLSARSNVRRCYNITSASVNRQRPESIAECKRNEKSSRSLL